MRPYSDQEKKLLIKVLRKYKQYPCLWDTTHKKFKNKREKGKALEDILRIWHKIDPTASASDVKKKLFYMCTSYRRNRIKVLNSNNYNKPSLWYYSYMNFLAGIDDGNVEIETYSDSDTDNDNDAFGVLDPDLQGSAGIDKSAAAFGETVGAQIHNLTETQRGFAEKLINDVIYHAKMHQLSASSSVNVTEELKGTDTASQISDTTNIVIPSSAPSWYDTVNNDSQEPSGSTYLTGIVKRESDETESANNFIITDETENAVSFIISDETF